ncbi:MAG: Hpt domain-containing protein, partial [Gammaproteobacteria bacterium]|nr:Hpt domain-containing protein [Gammaproteobacteria bacterium]
MKNRIEAKKEKHQLLREKFISKLDQRIAAIRDQVKVVCSNDASQQSLCDLHLLIHNLNGSAGTYEVKSISSVAKKLELKLADYVKHKTLPDREDWDLIESVVKQLEELIDSVQVSDAVTLISPELDN